MNAYPVIGKRSVSYHHMAELSSRRFMTGNRLSFFYLRKLIANVYRAFGKILQRLLDYFNAFITFESPYDDSCKYVSAVNGRDIELKIVVG